MTDTPRSNAVSPVVFMGSGGPDLTAPEAVERLIQEWEALVRDLRNEKEEDKLEGLATGERYDLHDYCVEASEETSEKTLKTLRALSAALLDVSKREAAMIARYDAKLEAADDALEEAVEWSDSLAETLQVVNAQHGGRNAARLLKDYRDHKATRAFLASIEGDKP